MKTVTEFSGFELKIAMEIRRDLVQIKVLEKQIEETKARLAQPYTDELISARKNPDQERAERKKFYEDTEIAIREELNRKVTESYPDLGERLPHLLNALQIIDGRRARDLRRIRVFTLQDKEVAPKDCRNIGEVYFSAEYLAPLPGRDGGHRGKFRPHRGPKGGHREGGPRRGRDDGRPPRGKGPRRDFRNSSKRPGPNSPESASSS